MRALALNLGDSNTRYPLYINQLRLTKAQINITEHEITPKLQIESPVK